MTHDKTMDACMLKSPQEDWSSDEDEDKLRMLFAAGLSIWDFTYSTFHQRQEIKPLFSACRNYPGHSCHSKISIATCQQLNEGSARTRAQLNRLNVFVPLSSLSAGLVFSHGLRRTREQERQKRPEEARCWQPCWVAGGELPGRNDGHSWTLGIVLGKSHGMWGWGVGID